MARFDLTVEAVTQTILAAWKEFLRSDIDLLIVDANERSISHRLAIHLEKIINSNGWPKGLHVDCEYNRDATAGEPPYSKRLNLYPPSKPSYDDTEAVTVFPDIIVHRRRSAENLLVVEIKKRDRGKKAEDFDKDQKVPQYLHELDYQFGAFLIVNVIDDVETIERLFVYDRPTAEPIDKTPSQ